MEAYLISLLMQWLPSSVKTIQLLKHAPAAVDTVKKLVALVQRTIETLKAAKLLKLMTPEQEAQLDADIAAFSSDPYWDEEEPAKPKT